MAGGRSLNLKQGPGPRDPRHPLRIRPGQMFFPRRGRRRMRLTIKRIDGEWVRGIREDGSEVNLALDRLLARDPREGHPLSLPRMAAATTWLSDRAAGAQRVAGGGAMLSATAGMGSRDRDRVPCRELARGAPSPGRRRLLHGESGFSQRRRARYPLLSTRQGPRCLPRGSRAASRGSRGGTGVSTTARRREASAARRGRPQGLGVERPQGRADRGGESTRDGRARRRLALRISRWWACWISPVCRAPPVAPPEAQCRPACNDDDVARPGMRPGW